jgi:hypothetical protein
MKARVRLPKLGRTARWILTIGIILIPIIVLGIIYTQHSGEESQLRADIDSAWTQRGYLIALWQQKITDANNEKAGLEADLSQANLQLQSDLQLLANTTQQLDEVAQENFPHNYTQSIEIGDKLFQAATDAGVTISSYTCSLPSERTLNGIKFQVFSIRLSVEGQVPNLLDFNIKVSQRFSDCDFKSVSTDMPAEEGGIASMSFNLDVYCYG